MGTFSVFVCALITEMMSLVLSQNQSLLCLAGADSLDI